MKQEETVFFSDEHQLAATWHWSDDAPQDAPRPLVIACSGFTGLRTIHPARFARFLTARGHACFGFDYRGFAGSEGPRRRVILEEQVRDIIHAVAFAADHPRVDPRRVFLLGWGMAGGLVLDAARELPNICGLIAANGFYNGKRVQLAHRGEDGLREYLTRVSAERMLRASTGQITMADPFDIYPLDPQSREYVDSVLRKTERYEAEHYSMEMADSLLRWNPEAYVPVMKIPLLITHGSANRLHPTTEADSLYATYGGPKELFWLEGAGHTEFMHDNDPQFQALAQRISDWIDERLKS